MYKKGVTMHKPILGIILLITIILTPLATTALSYNPQIHVEGVNTADRQDYQNAVDNPLQEDTLRYLYQGPVTIGVPGVRKGAWYEYNNTTIGYMKNLSVNVSNLGTILYMRYPTNNSSALYAQWPWLDVIVQDSPLPLKLLASTEPIQRPIEGWIVGVNLTPYLYSSVFDSYTDRVIVTYSDPYGNVSVVYNGTYLKITGVDTKVVVDNARLKVVKTNVTIAGVFLKDDPVTVINETISIKLLLEIATVVNKVDKTVRIYHKLTVTNVTLGPCDNATLTISLSRVAIIDACPICSHSFYYNGTVTRCEKTAYITLAWINSSLKNYLDTTVGGSYDLGYFADYMLAYPVPDKIAVISVINTPSLVPQYYYAPFINSIFTVRPNIRDQAFIRYEWDNTAQGTKDELVGLQIAYPMVIYGVYDVGPRYDGKLSVDFVNGLITDAVIRANEDYLNDTVKFLDLNQNAIDDTNPPLNIFETDLPVAWYPTDEFRYQLDEVFCPVTFDKFNNTTVRGVDFIVLPPSGAGADSAAATYMAMLRTATMVMFDVEPNGMVASVAYKYPSTKALPYLALKLTSWVAGERYSDRRGHFITADGRALLQSEFENVSDTPWTDDRYVLITVAGPHPNLVTYYFNDFLDIVRAMAGDLGTVIVVPSAAGRVYDITPYIGDSNYGLAVIAVARDNYGRTALVVHGLAAQDTYWAAYYVLSHWSSDIANITMYGNFTSILLEINYTNANMWATGGGLPIAHHTMPSFKILAAATPYSVRFP